MLLDMTISNFRSVRDSQTISFEAVKDNRLDEEKVVEVSDKLKVIKTLAIIGPNGAGKSTFVRALEALKAIITADSEMDNPLQLLAGTSFAYSDTKGGPADISLELVMGTDEDSGQAIVGKYSLIADREKIYEESYYLYVGRSRKLMFERKLIDGNAHELNYKYRWGKMFRGEKKRIVAKVPHNHTYLSASARKGSLTLLPLYTWFTDELMLLPFGLSPISEKIIVDQLKNHPSWKKALIDFLWSIDITDIRDVRFQDDRLVFVHTNVTQHYASYFSNESLSLRRLTSIAVALFESFSAKRCLVVDDFGMLLHPYALEHVVKVFETNNTAYGSQMMAVDCNPSLLKDGVLRRDAVWFAQKSSDSATVYFSLADFKFSKAKRELTGQDYMNGSYGALPITSEFKFVDKTNEKGAVK
jgi:AAA15 family ATPase/GTPase